MPSNSYAGSAKNKIASTPMPQNKKNKNNSKSSFLSTVLGLHVYLLILLMPLIFWPDTMTVFSLPKLILIRTLSVSAGFFALLKFFLSTKVNLKISRGVVFLGIWAVSLILSTIFSLNSWSSIFGQYGRYLGLITELNFLLIPIFIVSLWDKKEIHRLIWVSIATAMLSAIYALLQYFDFFGLFRFVYSWTDSPQNRLFGTVGHANHLGAFLAAQLALFIFFFKPKTIFAKVLTFLSYLILGSAILLTASRGALVAFSLSIAIIFLYRLSANWKASKNNFKKIGFVFCIITVVSLSSIAVLADLGDGSPNLLSQFGFIKRTEQNLESLNKGYVPERVSFMFSSLSMFADHPLLGTGLSTFRDAYSAYRRSDFQIDGPGNAQYITVPEAAHNEYLNILSTQGFLGLASFLAILFFTFKVVHQSFLVENTPELNQLTGLLAALLVFLIQIVFNFAELVNLTTFYFLLGCLWTYAPFYELKFKNSNLLKFPIVLIIIPLLALSFQNLIWPEAVADYYYKRAELASINKDFQYADQSFQKSIAARPQEYQLYQNYANFLLGAISTTSDFTEQENYLKSAVRNYQKSIDLNNNYASSYHNLGLAYVTLYNLTKKPIYLSLAKTSYQYSVDKSPNNPRYLYEFARKLHSEWDDKVAAVRLLKQAIAIAPSYQEPQDYLNFLYKNHPELANPLN